MKTKLIYSSAALLGVAFTTPLHAQLPNAWQITDNSTVGGSALNYTMNLSPEVQTNVNSGGFQYAATLRLLTNNPGAKTMALGYGLGSERFLIWLDLDSNGDLTAELDGGPTYTLTTNGTGAASYHTHEILFNGSSAMYRVDGHLFNGNWGGSGNDLTAGQVFWGAGSSPGTGTMNMHRLAFVAANVGLVAQYSAGTNGNPVAPDPVTLGWTNNIPATNAAPVSPDTVALPVSPLVTTLPGTALTPHEAKLEGVVNLGGQLATAWFEWGTNTSYGNITAPLFLKGDTNPVFVAQDISGLFAGETYHYRLVVENFGESTLGQDEAVMALPSFVVSNLANSGTGSLREAIGVASSGDSILIAANGTISLSSPLVIAKDLIINGPGPENLAISGNNATRVFSVTAAGTATISDLTIRNGRAANGAPGASGIPATFSIPQTGYGGDGGDGTPGGGIHNSGTLTVSNCVIAANRSGNGGSGGDGADGNAWDGDGGSGGDGGRGGIGGGIYNAGMLTLMTCTLTNNSTGIGGNAGDGGEVAILSSSTAGGGGGTGGVGGWGAAIYNGGALVLSDCNLSNNHCGQGGAGGIGRSGSLINGTDGPDGGGGYYGSGGGIFIDREAATTINRSVLSGGLASYGGGIHSYGFLTLYNSTLAGNTANFYHGGAIENEGTLTIIGSTISGNVATSSNPSVTPYAAGILNGGSSVLSITNTIVAGNLAAGSNLPDLAGSGSIFGTNNLIGEDPLLSPLGHYGGPTQTMRPLIGSPTIDAGLDTVTNLFATDQRGYPRLSGLRVDIGAVEAQVVSPDNPPVLNTPEVSGNGEITLSFTNAPDLDFTLLATTNVAWPLMQWVPLGRMNQGAPGEYHFIDPQAPKFPARFYQVVSP